MNLLQRLRDAHRQFNELSVEDKFEGKTRYANYGNRSSGLAMVLFAGCLIYGAVNSESKSLYMGGGLFLTEGLGDLLTGKHHYVSTRIIRGLKN